MMPTLRNRARRRFSAEHVGGGRIRYTCRTCGWSRLGGLIGPRGHKRPMSPSMAEKLARYQNHDNGASAVCPQCTRKNELP